MERPFDTPATIDTRLGWKQGRSERLAKAGRLPHFKLPDGSIRFDLDEVLKRVRRYDVPPQCAVCGVVLEAPDGDRCVRCAGKDGAR